MARFAVDDWPWTDTDQPRSRWGLWFISGEFLPTVFLWGYAAILLFPGSTFASSRAFAWLTAISRGDELPWAVAVFVLSIVAPLAVAMDEGRLRALSLISQGGLYAFWGISFLVNSRLGLGWWTYVACAAWLLWRGVSIVRRQARR